MTANNLNSAHPASIDLIISAGWVIPMKNPNEYFENYALAIHAGRILDLGPSEKILKKYSAKQTLHQPDHVILPGFINAHTHMPMSLLRGLADDLPLMKWLKENIWPAEAACVGPEFAKDGTELALLEMIQGGVTCVNDMYFFAEEIAEVIHRSGIRGFVANSILNIPMPWAPNLEDCFTKAQHICETVKQYPLVKATLAPHAPYTNDEKSLLRVKALAEKFNTPIHMHVQETLAEIHQHDVLYKERPLETLDRLGLVSPRLMAVHMTQVSPSDIELLRTKGASTVHCPESNMKLSSGSSPVSLLLKQNINVALGTDGAASNNNLDIFGEMRSAAFMAKLTTEDPESLSAYQVLSMATINGAKALGISAETGSLEINKSADFIAINLKDPATLPVYNPISQIVYAAHPHQVTDSWVAGKQILKNCEILTLDADQIYQRTEIWRQKISILVQKPTKS